MFVKRFFEPSLAQASYLIGCQQADEAIVIDANRDVEQYIEVAAQEGLRITHVTETHIHADYVSGSRELAHRTGASLCLSDEGDREWKYQFEHARKLKHGDRISIGNIRIDVLHTPGHTPEHLTFLITDGAAADKPIAAVTGDFVFVGDVGRPDLLEKAANIKGTMEAGARVLFASLQKFAKHEDWLQIWPGHGAGSACGKGISAIPSSTLGYERRFNWAFSVRSEDEFVKRVLAGQPEPPTYFASMKRINKEGPAILDGFHLPTRQPDDALEARVASGALVIDTRPAAVYAGGHVAGTINIPLNSSFLTWAGWLIPATADVYLILADESAAALTEVVRLLSLIGLDSVRGYFGELAIERVKVKGTPLTAIVQVSPTELASEIQYPDTLVLDVRGASEWQTGHLSGALHIPLGYLVDRLHEIPQSKTVVTQCQSGARSSIAASVLEQHGFKHVLNLNGGLAAWRAAGLPTVGEVDGPQALKS